MNERHFDSRSRARLNKIHSAVWHSDTVMAMCETCTFIECAERARDALAKMDPFIYSLLLLVLHLFVVHRAPAIAMLGEINEAQKPRQKKMNRHTHNNKNLSSQKPERRSTRRRPCLEPTFYNQQQETTQKSMQRGFAYLGKAAACAHCSEIFIHSFGCSIRRVKAFVESKWKRATLKPVSSDGGLLGKVRGNRNFQGGVLLCFRTSRNAQAYLIVTRNEFF